MPKGVVMSKLMWIAGILLIAAALALGVMFFASPATLAWLSFETVAILLVGGILALGLGSVISGLPAVAMAPVAERIAAPPPVPASPAAPAASPAQPIPEFGRRVSEAAAAAPREEEEDISAPTRQTLNALEQARKSIDQAFGPTADEPSIPPAPEQSGEPDALTPKGAAVVSATTAPPRDLFAETAAAAPAVVPPPAAEEPAPEDDVPPEEAAEDESLADGQLYVVEERTIRMHPARILSDGTVEAETAEGWMRFENLEHLDEYLDAMEPAKA